jgi:hypothetical protein
MAEITERREVQVRSGDSTFVFVAEPDDGRLRIEERDADGAQTEVCAITIADTAELSGFLEGLARVLGIQQPAGRGPVAQLLDAADDDAGRQVRQAASLGSGPAPAPPGDADDGDRDAIVERARQRNPQAFKSWSREEEQRVREAYERGTPISEIARDVQRSQRAVEMRLEKMGVRQGG